MRTVTLCSFLVIFTSAQVFSAEAKIQKPRLHECQSVQRKHPDSFTDETSLLYRSEAIRDSRLGCNVDLVFFYAEDFRRFVADRVYWGLSPDFDVVKRSNGTSVRVRLRLMTPTGYPVPILDPDGNILDPTQTLVECEHVRAGYHQSQGVIAASVRFDRWRRCYVNLAFGDEKAFSDFVHRRIEQFPYPDKEEIERPTGVVATVPFWLSVGTL